MPRGPRACLSQERLLEAPHLAWAAFVDLLSSADYDELGPVQRVAFLIFRYDGEVKTGGHLRYFRRWGTERLPETAAALERLGAAGHGAVLGRAAAAWDCGRTAEMDRLDDEFHAARPDLHVRLEAWLESHRDEFLAIEA